jgi:hypothetical protein
MNWRGLVVEIIRILWDNGKYRNNALLQKIHANWFDYWVQYKTDNTMRDVDRQVEAIQQEWAKEEPKPIIVEHAPDGSRAQELLGGTLEIRAPWYDPTSEPEASTKQEE